jgi:type IV secretion system protein VirB8
MNKQARESLDAYYVEADSWGKDRQEALRASRRVAWIVAGCAAAIAVMEAVALVVLMPLKTVEPYTLLVDRNTGFVQALTPLDPQRISGDAALTQSFLVQYVIARESFDVDTIQAEYRKVALWSDEQARSDYVVGAQPSNPQSPLALYPRTTVIETRVKSVSPMGPNTAMVRFETQRRDAGGQTQPPHAYVAIVRYRYSGAPMSVEDRFVNPLGFQVLRYRRDAEALPPEPAAPPPAQAGPPVVKVPAAPAPARPAATPQQPATPEPQL